MGLLSDGVSSQCPNNDCAFLQFVQGAGGVDMLQARSWVDPAYGEKRAEDGTLSVSLQIGYWTWSTIDGSIGNMGTFAVYDSGGAAQYQQYMGQRAVKQLVVETARVTGMTIVEEACGKSPKEKMLSSWRNGTIKGVVKGVYIGFGGGEAMGGVGGVPPALRGEEMEICQISGNLLGLI